MTEINGARLEARKYKKPITRGDKGMNLRKK